MTKVTIERELLERIDETAICDGTDATISDDLFTQLVAALAAPRQPPVQDSCARCGKETVFGKTHCEACCYEPISAPQPSDIEITKLLSCVRYLTGIAERGLKRQIREYESVESFVLGYVQSLERLQVDGWKLVPIEPTPDMAAQTAYNGTHYSDPFDFEDFKKDYAAMLAAAPVKREVVMPTLVVKESGEWGDAYARGFKAALREFARLNKGAGSHE